MATENLVKRGDVLYVPFSKLAVRENFNVRESMGDIEELAMSMYHNGVKMPLKGYKDGDKYIVIAGHRRMEAAAYIKRVWKKEMIFQFISYPKGTTDVELLKDHILTNDGKPLTPLEKAITVHRMLEAKMKPKEIAQAMSVSEMYVSNLKRLYDAPEEAKALVRNETISSTTLILQLKKKGDIADFILKAQGIANNKDVVRLDRPKKVAKKKASASTGVKKTPPAKSAPKQAKATTKDLNINSMKEFKKFVRNTGANHDVFPDKIRIAVYEFAKDLLNNRLDHDQIINYFTK